MGLTAERAAAIAAGTDYYFFEAVADQRASWPPERGKRMSVEVCH